jgi:putative endonuclease
MSMYYTYVLQSEKDNAFYIGFTEDLKLRFEHHSKGQVVSTRNRRPLKLIYYEACVTQKEQQTVKSILKHTMEEDFFTKGSNLI